MDDFGPLRRTKLRESLSEGIGVPVEKIALRVEAASATWRGGGDQLGGQYPIEGGGPRCQPEHAARDDLAHLARALAKFAESTYAPAKSRLTELDDEDIGQATVEDLGLEVDALVAPQRAEVEGRRPELAEVVGDARRGGQLGEEDEVKLLDDAPHLWTAG